MLRFGQSALWMGLAAMVLSVLFLWETAWFLAGYKRIKLRSLEDPSSLPSSSTPTSTGMSSTSTASSSTHVPPRKAPPVRPPPLAEPAGSDDYWIERGAWNVRVHRQPRIQLFDPSDAARPFGLDELTGDRVTYVTFQNDGETQILRDIFHYKVDAKRRLDRTWKGVTEFVIRGQWLGKWCNILFTGDFNGGFWPGASPEGQWRLLTRCLNQRSARKRLGNTLSSPRPRPPHPTTPRCC